MQKRRKFHLYDKVIVKGVPGVGIGGVHGGVSIPNSEGKWRYRYVVRFTQETITQQGEDYLKNRICLSPDANKTRLYLFEENELEAYYGDAGESERQTSQSAQPETQH